MTIRDKPHLRQWLESQYLRPTDTEEARLLRNPARRFFFRASRAGYPPLALHLDEIIYGAKDWAPKVNKLEAQKCIGDLLLIEHDFIVRYGDCLGG